MEQYGFFDLSERYEQLSKQGDPLEKLNAMIDWKIFRPLLKRALNKKKVKKSNAGRPAYDPLFMFKIVVLQNLYNISDDQTEYQIRDRLSFMRFLGLHSGSRVPDSKTIWLFKETLTRGDVLEKLFMRFDRFLSEQGFSARVGQIVDASIIPVPRQRNTREENAQIKAGEVPEEWQAKPEKLRQKDVEARWTKKLGQTYYGYKNHINVDVKHKLIRKQVVTSANVPDIMVFDQLLDKKNKGKRIWGDKAYRGKRASDALGDRYKDRIHERATTGQWLPEYQRRENVRRSKVRVRVEHVFGFMANSMGGKFMRCIGMRRARAKLTMMNLVYNFCRYEQLQRVGVF